MDPRRRLANRWWILPVLMLPAWTGCLPNDAFKQVLGENLFITAATAIQTATWVFFNTLFGFI